MRVLVVDDEPDMVETMTMLLAAWGHTIVPAYSGTQALERAVEQPPDAVLLDLVLPDMDGSEVARQLRRQPELEQVLIISLSGHGQNEHRQRAIEAGCDRHFTKPAPFDEIEAILAQHIAGANGRPHVV